MNTVHHDPVDIIGGTVIMAAMLAPIFGALAAFPIGGLVLVSGRFTLEEKLPWWRSYFASGISLTITCCAGLASTAALSLAEIPDGAILWVFFGPATLASLLALWGFSAWLLSLSAGRSFLLSLTVHLIIGIMIMLPVLIAMAVFEGIAEMLRSVAG
ncbi:MAG: hypothetical protein VYC34_11270 [Planctomycetota bacterium]|nr:hypothetical protein [Planctomycetota bacterium]